MNTRTGACCGLAVLLFLSGCLREPEKSMRALIDSCNSLSDTFHEIQDPKSAEASLDELDRKYSTAVDIFKRLPALVVQYKDARTTQATVDQIKQDMASALARMKTEQTRLKNLRGLPIRFWEIVNVRSLEIAVATIELVQVQSGNVAPANAQRIYELRDMLDKCGFAKILTVGLDNVPANLASIACEKLKKLAPEAKLFRGNDGTEESVVMGPIDDYHAFVSKIDFATVDFEDEPQRVIKIRFDLDKLALDRRGARRSSRATEDTPMTEEQLAIQEQASKRAEEAQARFQKKIADERAAREKEANGPDPSDPTFFEQMAERMASSDYFRRQKAIDALVKADPANVASPETKKKIARLFKDMAESDSSLDRKKAIKGLELYAGNYSVPILLKMLVGQHSFDEEAILRTLADLKDERAAPAFASRLGDFRMHELAFEALNEMGSGAEDALLAVAPSNDPKICIAALTLLGNVGTDKSLEIMRKSQESRNPEVRAAGRTAQQKIRLRLRAAKTAAEPASDSK